jgi:hypothetical protein
MARLLAPIRLRLSQPIAWAALCVGVAAVVVQTTRIGIDILALLVAGFLLLLVERTVGDWVAERVGPAWTALLFAVVAGLGVAYVLTGSGRARAAGLFAAAEARGYRALYFEVPVSTKVQMPEVGVASLPSGPFTARPAVAAAVPSSLGTATTGTAAAVPSSPGTATTGTAAAVPSSPGTATTGSRPSGSPLPASVPASSVAVRRRSAKNPRIDRLLVSPEVSVVGDVIGFRVLVSFDEDGSLPKVEFSVNGRVVATAAVVDGAATARWKTAVPGQYVVRARLPGGFSGGMVASATLNVLPRKL